MCVSWSHVERRHSSDHVSDSENCKWKIHVWGFFKSHLFCVTLVVLGHFPSTNAFIAVLFSASLLLKKLIDGKKSSVNCPNIKAVFYLNCMD